MIRVKRDVLGIKKQKGFSLPSGLKSEPLANLEKKEDA